MGPYSNVIEPRDNGLGPGGGVPHIDPKAGGSPYAAGPLDVNNRAGALDGLPEKTGVVAKLP